MEKQKARSEIDLEYTYDLTKIFKSKEEFIKEYNEIKILLDKFDSYKGVITKNPSNLYEFLTFNDSFERRIYKLYYYAHLSYDVDTTNKDTQKLDTMAQNLFAEYTMKTSFVMPELMDTPYSKINEYIKKYPKLEEYSFSLEKLYRYQEHTLDKKSEEMLSKLSKVLGSSEETFEKLTDSDFTFGTIMVDGKEVELTASNYSLFIKSNNKNVRKQAFKKLFNKYAEYKNTLFSTYKTNAEEKIALAKIKNYNNALEASLFDDNVDVSIYNNLIDTVNKNMDIVYDYFDLKKEMLGLDEIHNYDTYVNMAPVVDKKYTYSEVQKMVKEALKPLGDDYQELLDKAFLERWVDVYNNKGKRGGAYSSGFYDTNPYVLMNFEGTANDVSTLAHELGHSMHTYYSCKNNKYQYSNYSIFVAEVASTVNELLLAKYRLNNAKDDSEKLSILNDLMDLYKATIYRQTMFAEFERDICKKLEDNIPITPDEMCEDYYNLNKKYFGSNFNLDEEIKYEWSRIPHFYYNFYVYKYAIGLSCASTIVENILSGKDKDAENYKKFLKAGSSVYPVDALKIAGVDPTSKETIETALNMFKGFIGEYKQIVNNKPKKKVK